MPPSCHCQPNTAILMLLSSTCPPHVAILTLPPKLHCCIWNGEQQKYKKTYSFQISWNQHDDKKDNLNWYHHCCSVCILLIIAVECQPGSHTKLKPQLCHFQCMVKVHMVAISNTYTELWKRRVQKSHESKVERNNSIKIEHHRHHTTVIMPPSCHCQPNTAILMLLSSTFPPHVAILTLPPKLHCCI